MDSSKRNAVTFLEKEINTYTALSRFFSKKRSKTYVRLDQRRVLITPAFYAERMKEAREIVCELRKAEARMIPGGRTSKREN